MNPLELKLFDLILAGAIDILRLSRSKRRVMLTELASLERKLVGQLNEANLQRGERERINKAILKAGDTIGQAYNSALMALDLPEVSKTVAEIMAGDLKLVLGPIAKDLNLPLDTFHAAIASNSIVEGVPQAKWWLRQAETTKLNFEAEVRRGLASNETNDQIVRRIVGTPSKPGVMSLARHQGAALVQTGVASVANTARLETFKANNDLVIGVKQVSTLDSHTSLICISYSGACWDLEGKPIRGTRLPFNGGTPRHFNCRSVLVPLLPTFKDMGIDLPDFTPTTRASDEGQISAETTFEAFLKRKSAAYVDDLLGPGRADLWRNGKLTLRDLVGGDGRPLTLEQLRKRAGLD